ncbi:c-type cytochrome [Xylophilus sp. GOD-11R]|uniref:c-type cytochrome n=1 Tax=Xylophilus sp. GOD-11R TaxID=3089814 RepID=UPI00298CA3E0|nr:c-type cytochrome [Xylophilus sp. GOD-11R]WPB58098.1 c-type cytochrome [Xylophilus sp. GOD-11R]
MTPSLSRLACRGLLAGALAFGALSGGTQPAMAQVDLARANGCLVCHSVERKVIGPALRDVAQRYRSQADAPDRLTAIVLKGGVGQWGTQPMPPNGGVSPADARALVGWILALP